MMKIHYLQHVPFEGLGSIATWAEQGNHRVTATRLYEDEPFPALTDFDGLIIMGGPMNIYQYDQYPWLVREKQFIAQVLQTQKPVIGICLGAQLIADVLGANVYPGAEKEIGWFPIQRREAESPTQMFQALPLQGMAFHWHGDTFDIPAGAIALASSAACPNQAFIYNERVLALQFHLEATPDSVQSLLDHCGDEVVMGKYIQTPAAIQGDRHRFNAINDKMSRILDALFLNR